jgi:hypothetical protein
MGAGLVKGGGMCHAVWLSKWLVWTTSGGEGTWVLLVGDRLAATPVRSSGPGFAAADWAMEP